MHISPNIDELLNSYIDGELTERQQSQVQQMLIRDSHIAKRLRQLQKLKVLIGSLPRAEVPDDVLDQVKASLERRTLLDQQVLSFDSRKGARHLIGRKVLATAAMIGLIAILGLVIYTIVEPQKTNETVVIDQRQPIRKIELINAMPTLLTTNELNGRIEFKTGFLVAIDAFINRAIEDNGISECVSQESLDNKMIYTFSCDKQRINSLLADLSSIWQKIDLATLYIETEKFSSPVVVNSVTGEQILDIIDQDSYGERIQLAKNFAVLNSMDELMPSKEIFAAIDDTKVSLIMPKPVLTWNQKADKKNEKHVIEDGEKVSLTIVLIGI